MKIYFDHEGGMIQCNVREATAAELRELAATLLDNAHEKAIAEDKAYCAFLAERRAALQVGDKIRVTINGHKHVTTVRGFSQNYYGLPFVKFILDWDEGPLDYTWSVSLVEKV